MATKGKQQTRTPKNGATHHDVLREIAPPPAPRDFDPVEIIQLFQTHVAPVLQVIAGPIVAKGRRWVERHLAARVFDNVMMQEYLIARSQLGPDGNPKVAMDGAVKVATEFLSRRNMALGIDYSAPAESASEPQQTDTPAQ